MSSKAMVSFMPGRSSAGSGSLSPSGLSERVVDGAVDVVERLERLGRVDDPRLRPGGSFSSRKLSPWWNRIGGVDRSTSSTKPGLGISGCAPSRLLRSKAIFTRAAGPGAGGVGDGVGVAARG